MEKGKEGDTHTHHHFKLAKGIILLNQNTHTHTPPYISKRDKPTHIKARGACTHTHIPHLKLVKGITLLTTSKQPLGHHDIAWMKPESWAIAYCKTGSAQQFLLLSKKSTFNR